MSFPFSPDGSLRNNESVAACMKLPFLFAYQDLKEDIFNQSSKSDDHICRVRFLWDCPLVKSTYTSCRKWGKWRNDRKDERDEEVYQVLFCVSLHFQHQSREVRNEVEDGSLDSLGVPWPPLPGWVQWVWVQSQERASWNQLWENHQAKKGKSMPTAPFSFSRMSAVTSASTRGTASLCALERTTPCVVPMDSCIKTSATCAELSCEYEDPAPPARGGTAFLETVD